MLFGKWRLQGTLLSHYIKEWEAHGCDKKQIAANLIRYQTEALQWEREYPQLCLEAKRTFQKDGLIPRTNDGWNSLYWQLEPSYYFDAFVYPTWPDISARRAMAYFAVGMQILDDTENSLLESTG